VYEEAGVLSIPVQALHQDGMRLMPNFAEFKKILDQIYDMAFIIDTESERIILANQRACEVLEYSVEEITQLRLKDIHPYDMIAVINFAEKVKNKKCAITNELSCRTKSGQFIDAEVSGRTMNLNGNDYLIATVRELNEEQVRGKDSALIQIEIEKQVQTRTRELEEYNSRLLNEIVEQKELVKQASNFAFFPEENPNPVFRVSEEGKILYANLASSFILEKWETGVGGVLPEIFSKNISYAFEFQKPLEVECQVSDQFYSFVISKVLGKNYVNVYAQRITERKKTQEALLRAKDDAENANQAKSSFLTRMSHELRTPLNAIMGFSQTLQMDSENSLSQTQKDHISQIFKAGRHLLDLINEVLDLAKVESGKMTLNPQPVNVIDLIEEMDGIFQPKAKEYGVQLSVITDSSMELIVCTDKLRLRQVLLNLVSNAIKYNHKGGSVTVACKLLNHNNLQIDVIDTGPGISVEDQDELFEPFNRLENENSGVEGTGIGLTVTKELVELMGGSIGVISRLGEGSHFYIELPVEEKL
jgi:PAS domain S-box-containing protein